MRCEKCRIHILMSDSKPNLSEIDSFPSAVILQYVVPIHLLFIVFFYLIDIIPYYFTFPYIFSFFIFLSNFPPLFPIFTSYPSPPSIPGYFLLGRGRGGGPGMYVRTLGLGLIFNYLVM